MFATIYEARNHFRRLYANGPVGSKFLNDLDAMADLVFEGITGFAFSIESGEIKLHA